MGPDSARRAWLALILLIGIAPYWVNGFYNARLSMRAFWIVEIITWVIVPAILIATSLKARLTSRSTLGLHMNVGGQKREWLFILLMLITPILFVCIDRWAVDFAVRYLPLTRPSSFQYRHMLPPPGPQTGHLRLLAVYYFAASAGLVEEIYYRGMMSELFSKDTMGSVTYILVSAAVFASAHWEMGIATLFESFIIGLLAATFFRITRNLWPLIAGHALCDWLWFSGG